MFTTMFRNLVIPIVLVSLILATQGTLSKKPIKSSNTNNTALCLRRANELDKCLPKLTLYGDRDFEPPKTESDLDEHCKVLDENLRCVSSYSRDCLPSFAKNLYSVVTRRLKGQFSKRCKTKDGRRDFMNLMACADVKHMEPAHKCMDSFVAHLEHIGRGKGNQTRQIQLTCCTFQTFQECIFTVSKKMECRDRVVSAEKSIEYVRGIINSMGGDVMDIMCGKYDSISSCAAGHPQLMKQFEGISDQVRNGTLKPVANSPLEPMLRLFIESQNGDS